MSKRHRSQNDPDETPVGCAPATLVGGLIAAVGYCILATHSPHAWGIGTWRLLAFLLVPGLAGAAAGLISSAGSDLIRFRAGALPTGVVMGIYTWASLALVHSRLAIPSEESYNGIWFVVVASYAGLAAVAGGTVSWLAASFSRAPQKGHL